MLLTKSEAFTIIVPAVLLISDELVPDVATPEILELFNSATADAFNVSTPTVSTAVPAELIVEFLTEIRFAPLILIPLFIPRVLVLTLVFIVQFWIILDEFHVVAPVPSD